MTDKEKLKKIQSILKKYRKKIDKAVKDDCEVTLGGNGINCSEADSTFKPIEKKIYQILSRKTTEANWIITGDSESGDHYSPKRYDHEPTEEDKRKYIIEDTDEDIDNDGPGAFGSYVYLKVERV